MKEKNASWLQRSEEKGQSLNYILSETQSTQSVLSLDAVGVSV